MLGNRPRTRLFLLAAALLALLAVYGGIGREPTSRLASTPPRLGRAPGSPRDEQIIRQIEAGTKRAWAAVHNGRGTVTLYEWRRYPNGNTEELESGCEISFAGDRFKANYADTFARGASPADPINQRAARFARRLLNRAYSNRDLHSGIGAFDGKTWTEYRRDHNDAVEARSSLYYPVRKWSRTVEPFRGAEPLQSNASKHLPGGLVQTGGQIHVLGRERIDGRECIVVEQERAAIFRGSVRNRIIARFWVCPALDYAVPRVQTWGRGRRTGQLTLWGDARTTFRQYSRGLWAPAREDTVQYDWTTSGTWARRTTVTYDPRFRLNVPAKSLDLKLRLPSGIKVFDLDGGGFRKIP